MLTADLALSFQRGDRIRPRYVNPEDANRLREAEDLINIFRRHEGDSRAALEESVREYVGTGTDYKFLRGLTKLLTDRCEFETGGAVDPVEARRTLFFKARSMHPVVADDARASVVAEAAGELACTPEALFDALYADLPENQKLIEFEPLTNHALLDLYNVAQAQALLYRCLEMRLWVEPQAAENYRELFGAIKAYRLIHTVKGNSRDGYEIRLDGPVSIFQRSQKYGVQMAVFLPALLLCSGWRMRADISAKPAGILYFELNGTQTQLRSHYESIIGYENPVVEKLAEAWVRAGGEWTLERSNEVIDLRGSAFIPDYLIRHQRTGREVHLEILGFWTPEHLRERLKEFAHAGLKNFIIAAWEELRGSREALTTVPPHTILFKKSLDPGVVGLMVEKVLAEEQEA